MKTSSLEIRVMTWLCAFGFPGYEREYRFHKTRKWRFDFAWPDKKIAIECDGAIWTYGRHSRGSGIISDAQKYNEAILDGWKIFRITTGNIGDLEKIKEKYFT